jgi:hypothetical protein
VNQCRGDAKPQHEPKIHGAMQLRHADRRKGNGNEVEAQHENDRFQSGLIEPVGNRTRGQNKTTSDSASHHERNPECGGETSAREFPLLQDVVRDAKISQCLGNINKSGAHRI